MIHFRQSKTIPSQLSELLGFPCPECSVREEGGGVMIQTNDGHYSWCLVFSLSCLESVLDIPVQITPDNLLSKYINYNVALTRSGLMTICFTCSLSWGHSPFVRHQRTRTSVLISILGSVHQTQLDLTEYIQLPRGFIKIVSSLHQSRRM